MELISDELLGFTDRYINEKTNNIKVTRISRN
jgi:hypothetical protein